MSSFEDSAYLIAINRAFEEKNVEKLISLKVHFLLIIDDLHIRRIQNGGTFLPESQDYCNELEFMIRTIKQKISILIDEK